MSAASVQGAVTDRFGDGTAEDPSGNEFVIFSKPELGRLDDERLATVWDLFAGAFTDYGVRVHRVKIMTGPELEAAGAMQQHYGVINQISREGRPALTEAAEQALQHSYGDALDGSEVIGGHQFLDRYPEVSAYALAMLFANADVQRLGPGTYAARLRMDADQVVVLNGFHPRQLGFFTAADADVRLPARQQRHRLGGAAVGADRRDRPGQGGGGLDPGTAQGRPRGVRAEHGQLELQRGAHVRRTAGGPRRAGPVLRRGARTAGLDLCGGPADAGLTDDDLPGLVANPVITAGGERGTAFDLTEGLNAEPAAKLLAEARAQS